MMKYIKVFFSNMLGKNKEIYQKPLNAISILLVIAFDIFLFYQIFSWYNYQKDLVVSPYEKYDCVWYFWENNDLIYNIDYYYPNDKLIKIDSNWEKITKNFNSWVCNQIDQKVLSIKNSSQFKEFKIQKNILEHDISTLENKKADYEYQYQDFLQESKAWIDNENERLSDIDRENARKDYQSMKDNLFNLNTKKQNLISTFKINSTQYIDLKNYIDSNQKDFFKNYDKDIFWYPVKITFFQALLLLPLFLLSLLFYKIFLKRQNKIFTILFSNLTFITWIFVFILFLKVVYFIIPKKFLAWFIALLKSLNLWFLWNYILILLWIGLFWFIIYLSQKWAEKISLIKKEQEKQMILQNMKKVQLERFEKGFCINCSTRLLKESRFCQTCWDDQYYECKNCKNLVPKIFIYCNKCWTNHN